MMINKRILISVYCILIQHGYHVFCRLIPKGAIAAQEWYFILSDQVHHFKEEIHYREIMEY